MHRTHMMMGLKIPALQHGTNRQIKQFFQSHWVPTWKPSEQWCVQECDLSTFYLKYFVHILLNATSESGIDCMALKCHVLTNVSVAGSGALLGTNCVTVSLNAVISKHPNVLVFFIDELVALSLAALLCYCRCLLLSVYVAWHLYRRVTAQSVSWRLCTLDTDTCLWLIHHLECIILYSCTVHNSVFFG